MSISERVKLSETQAATTLKKLLGSLELEVMEFMWQAGKATVQQVTEVINRERPIAYTTVMTVMGRLVDKGLLARIMEERKYRYRVAQSSDEFLHETFKKMVRTLVDDFGDLAVEAFWEEIHEGGVDRFERLRDLVQETTDESNS